MALYKEGELQALRIIDASLNRLGEGLRLLEDIARMSLNDAALTQQLKTMRHDLIKGDIALNMRLIQSRDSVGDVGISLEGEETERELPLVLVANARRVQESLRTLEEMTKVPGIAPGLESAKFKQARFKIYTIEQQLLSKLARKDKASLISGLYVIIDTRSLTGRPHLELAKLAARGGAKIIQLRDKVSSKKELVPVARQLKEFCATKNILFIVNDYLDIALESDADGLHIGQEDILISSARKLLPINKILGVSVNTVKKAKEAETEGADYIGVGAMYPTQSKEEIEVVGPKRLSMIKKAVSIPVVAVGGVTRDNVPELINAGADSVAVISAVCAAKSPENACRQIAEIFRKKK